MKIKSLILGTLLVVATLSMSGCSSNQLGTPTNINNIGSNPDAGLHDVEIYLIGTKNDTSNSLSRASDIEESAFFTLQYTAETTLERGDKYFSVNAPKAMSNFDGSTITTMQEFIDKCGTSALGGLGSAFDKFGTNSYYCNISGTKIVHSGFIEVAFFKEQPLDILVWDAQAVIDYLKEDGEYKEYNKDDIKTVSASKMRGGGNWMNKYRTAK